MSNTAEPLPLAVKAASILLLTYGGWVVWQATAAQVASDWTNASDYPRALIRLGGMGLIVYGLLGRQRWGWWLGILVPSVFLLTALSGAAIVFGFAGSEGLTQMAGSRGGFVAALTILLVSVVLLLLPSSRATFRSARTLQPGIGGS